MIYFSQFYSNKISPFFFFPRVFFSFSYLGGRESYVTITHTQLMLNFRLGQEIGFWNYVVLLQQRVDRF